MLPRTTAFGYFAHNMIGLSERVTDHLAAPPPHLPRERLWQVRAREVVLRDRRTGTAAGVSAQRPAWHSLADAARTYVNRYARCRAGAS